MPSLAAAGVASMLYALVADDPALDGALMVEFDAQEREVAAAHDFGDDF